MRRIPRPQRAIDASLPVSPLAGHRVYRPTCLRVVSPYNHLRTTSASFSTTPSFSFLLGGKQDKKKHQQFVRRWQKRLLGDSEPIGAHVDPYDPTSPVRIAPDEQGEELEVLEDQKIVESQGPLYQEAHDGRRLRHVGGKEWTEQLEEGILAKEFEKLTLRTYTPLSLKMADQIEDLTGTPYTLRDENLMMAQMFHDFTGKPYTDWSFGRWTRVRGLDSLRENFHRAVVEIYALKQAGKDLDISASANRGVYDAPKWLRNVKLQRKGNGDFALAFPKHHTLQTLLEDMARVPEWQPEQGVPAEEELEAEEGEELVMEGPQEPVMDPDTPPAKRAALVKQDPEKKPFDFMSNRPVPRAKIVESPVEDLEKAQELVAKESTPEPIPTSAPSSADLEAAAEASRSAISEMRSAILESAARSAEQNVAALRKAVRDGVAAQAGSSTIRVPIPEVDARWRHVPLTDPAIKFALTKRLAQLTGLYISDPNLTSASTLGDLYHHLCDAEKPKPTKLFNLLNIEGSRQNHKANRLAESGQAAIEIAAEKKPGVGELLKLRNVQIFGKKPNAVEERRKTGLQKVVHQELKSRRLVAKRGQRVSPEKEVELQARRLAESGVIEGTRRAPEFGLPIPPTIAEKMKKRTEKKKGELADMGIDGYSVDRYIRQSNRPAELNV